MEGAGKGERERKVGADNEGKLSMMWVGMYVGGLKMVMEWCQ